MVKPGGELDIVDAEIQPWKRAQDAAAGGRAARPSRLRHRSWTGAVPSHGLSTGKSDKTRSGYEPRQINNSNNSQGAVSNFCISLCVYRILDTFIAYKNARGGTFFKHLREWL